MEKSITSVKCHCLLYFLRDKYKNVLSIENAQNEQRYIFKELSNIGRGEKPIVKISFLGNIRILLEARENVLNSFKSNLFPIENSMPHPTVDPIAFYTSKKQEHYVGHLR